MDFLNFTLLNLFEPEGSIDTELLFPDIECFKDPWKTNQRELLFAMRFNFEDDIEAYLGEHEHSRGGVYKLKEKTKGGDENRIFLIKMDQDI